MSPPVSAPFLARGDFPRPLARRRAWRIMIWTIEPTSPWRVTAADWNSRADASGDATAPARVGVPTKSALFLEHFVPPDRSIVEIALEEGLRMGAARCTCRLAGGVGPDSLAGLLEISQLSPVFTESDRTLVARWTQSNGDARVVDDRSMRQFLGGISHDLRTPLNGVLGMSRLLLDSGLRGDQVDYARVIDSSAEQLLSVIEDLLEFATLDTRTALHPVDVDPRALVSEVTAALTSRAAEREIEVCALIAANVPEVVGVDESRLRQVLMYVVEDGLERTAVGDVIIRVGFDGGHLRFDVSVDEPTWADAPKPPRGVGGGAPGSAVGLDAGGRGITFGHRADPSPRAAVCRHLVSLMDGVLDHQADAHGGASHGFSVRVQPRPAAPPALLPPFVSLAGRRVLCVDDQPVSRRVLLERLRGWNLSVEVTDEAHAALTRMKVASAAGVPFELVIIDLRLPGVDGLALARLIKADAALGRTKLILLTGYPARGQAELAHEAGIDAYLQKPIREAPLRACLDALLNPDPAAAARAGLSSGRRYEEESERGTLRPRVLVAEDHPLNQKVTVQLLEKLGCRVDVVATGEDAVAAVGRTPYHLVLMDSRLPSLDGAGATRAIRQLADSAALTPIIALARDEDEAAREAAIAAGANDVVSKPLRLGTLREKLAQWIAATPPR